MKKNIALLCTLSLMVFGSPRQAWSKDSVTTSPESTVYVKEFKTLGRSCYGRTRRPQGSFNALQEAMTMTREDVKRWCDDLGGISSTPPWGPLEVLVHTKHTSPTGCHGDVVVISDFVCTVEKRAL